MGLRCGSDEKLMEPAWPGRKDHGMGSVAPAGLTPSEAPAAPAALGVLPAAFPIGSNATNSSSGVASRGVSRDDDEPGVLSRDRFIKSLPGMHPALRRYFSVAVCRRLPGRVSIVTGGAHGIGRAIVSRLASEGARCTLHKRYRAPTCTLPLSAPGCFQSSW
jgi:hypothetical protein